MSVVRASRWGALLLPSGVTLVPFFFASLVVVALYSVYRFGGAGVFEHTFTLENYRAVVTDAFYREIFLRTLGMGLLVVAIALVTGFPLAVVIVRGQRRWRILLTVLVLLPLMTSAVVRSYGWTLLFADSGFFMHTLNDVLGVVGIGPVRLQFSYIGTSIALAEVLLPLMVFSLAGALQQVDPDIEEAARSLGASRLRVLRDVLLPLAAPGVFAGCLLVFVLSISAFPTPQLVGGAQTQVIATLIYSQATTVFNWPLSSAMSLVLMVIVLLAVGLQSLGARRSQRWRG